MKRIVIKDWLYQKIAREHKAPRVWSGNVDVIFQETDKAYKVIMGAVNHPVTTWIPKSCCEWEECDWNEQTHIVHSYDEAMDIVREIRSYFC